MWPEMPTRRSASLCCGDSAAQPELSVSHEPIALLLLRWNTHIDVLMPLGNREWNPRIQFLLRRPIRCRVHYTNQLVVGIWTICLRVQKCRRPVGIKVSPCLRIRGLTDEMVDVLMLVRHKDCVAVGLRHTIVAVVLRSLLRGGNHGVRTSFVTRL